MSQYSDNELEGLLRQAAQAFPEHPPLGNLAARAMCRANAERNSTRMDAVRLARHSIVHQLFAGITAAAVAILALIAVDHLYDGISGMTETADAATDPAANDTFDVVQILQSDQMTTMAIGVAMVLSLTLVVHLVLSGQEDASFPGYVTAAARQRS
jgi:hypothetical protein